jgi:AbrB family looped-hinge helix DNA binding protein
MKNSGCTPISILVYFFQNLNTGGTMTTLTAKYSMVVPKEARKDLNLRPGMKIDLQKNERGQWVLVKIGVQAEKWIGRYPSSKRTAEEMAELRGRNPDDFN